VLLAVDRTSASDAAARVALGLADRHGARVHVITVIDTRSAPMPPPLDLAIGVADEAYGDTVHEEQKRELRIALSTMLGRTVDWPVEVKLGTPSHVIVETARRIGASLVVLGLRRHHAVDRAFNDETALNVMRTAPCPVLGVTPETKALPRRIVVGVDFSRASLAAARAARALVAEGGTLVLAYAAPPTESFLPDDGERVIHELGVAAALEWFAGELAAPGLTIERAVLQHRPGQSVCEALMNRADDTPTDMLALGSVRHGRVERWILGSVTTDVARDGSYSVLVVPPGEMRGGGR
jgi:nucleotide-binding universal stress UspA family protein